LRQLIRKWHLMLALLLVLITGSIYTLNSPWTEFWLDGKEFWYTLHWKGEKVGHVHLQYLAQEDGIFQISQITKVQTKNRGKAVHLVEKEVLRFDTRDSGELISIFYHRKQDDLLEQTSLVKRGDYFEGEKRVNDKKSMISLKSKDYLLSEYLQLMRWALMDPVAGEQLTVRQFDLKELSLNSVHYQIQAQQHSVKSIKVEFQQKGRNWKGIVELSSDGIPHRYTVGQMVEQRLSSRAEALAINSDKDYYLSQIIQIDKPLGIATTLNSLTLSTNAFNKGSIVSNQRQYIDDMGILHLKAQSTPEAVKSSDDLQQASTSVIFDKNLIELANYIIGDSNQIEEKVVKLLSFVSSYIEDSPVIRPMTIDNILQQRKGDCTEHTQLFIALARALAIPAREVKGLVYLGDQIQGFGGHVWSEVIIDDQWVAVDPTWNLPQLSATHIQLAEHNDTTMLTEMSSQANFSFKLMTAEYR